MKYIYSYFLGLHINFKNRFLKNLQYNTTFIFNSHLTLIFINKIFYINKIIIYPCEMNVERQQCQRITNHLVFISSQFFSFTHGSYKHKKILSHFIFFAYIPFFLSKKPHMILHSRLCINFCLANIVIRIPNSPSYVSLCSIVSNYFQQPTSKTITSTG